MKYADRISILDNRIRVLNEMIIDDDKRMILKKEMGRLFTIHLSDGELIQSHITLKECEAMLKMLYILFLKRVIEFN